MPKTYIDLEGRTNELLVQFMFAVSRVRFMSELDRFRHVGKADRLRKLNGSGIGSISIRIPGTDGTHRRFQHDAVYRASLLRGHSLRI